MASNRKHRIRYEVRLVFWEVLIASLIGTFLAFTVQNSLMGLNFDAVMQSLVALNSGIIIALFVALFHGTNRNVEIFKQFRNATRQVYLVFLMNSVLVCLMSVFVHNISLKPEIAVLPNQMTFNLIASSIAIVVTAKNIHLIYRLLQINLRTP